MKKLIVVLLLVANSLCAVSVAQTKEDEIRQLVFEAPTVEAIEKAEGEELLIVCYWVSLLAAYGEIEQATKIAEQINAIDSENSSKQSQAGYFFIARGMACNNHLAEATQLLQKLLDDENELHVWLAFLFAEFSDADAVIREAAQISQGEDSDELIDSAIQLFLERHQKDQAMKLINLLSSLKAKQDAVKEITTHRNDEEWELKLRAEYPDVNPLSTDTISQWPLEKLTVGGLLALERHDEAINKAVEARDNDGLSEIADHFIEHRDLHQARLIANLCSNPLLKLSTYIDILEAYLMAEKPGLKKQLRRTP